MPILPNAQNLTVAGGQFTDITIVNMNGPTGIDILLEASCPEAAHDSSARSYPPRCFPGTREQYISDIVDWGISTLRDTPQPIYWMKGPAGVGKSAVAQTCSEKLKYMERLGAAFFFSISGRDDPQKFFPSIAYQLSTIHPPYRDLIDGKIRHDKTLVNKAMSFQFKYLIAEPLRELALQGKGIGQRTVIIVDGLDECEGPSAQSEIIRITAEAASEGTLPLCWAFFSRPEPQIEATFSSPSIDAHCHKVFLPISRDADGEIEMYLKNGFENIIKRLSISLESQWPSVEDMAILVGAARGLFIYATTVIRFVDQLNLPGPQKRLCAIIDVILERRERDSSAGTNAEGPFAELDAFYRLILQRIPMDIFPSIHLLLAVVARCGRLNGILIANVLGLSKEEFETVCNHARAVVHLQEPGKAFEFDPTISTKCLHTLVNQTILNKPGQRVSYNLGGQVAFYHKSFDDFLLDSARSGNYCVKGSEALANHCLKMQLDYDRTYCWKGSELVLAPGVTDSASSLSYPYTSELANSLIKAAVYVIFGNEDTESFFAFRVFGALSSDRDFRKNLHISTRLGSHISSLPSSSGMWGYNFWFKSYPGTQVACAPLAKFSVGEFKLMVKQRKQANVLQQYHPKWPSRITYIFRNKSGERFESAGYRVGKGKRSIFWYWEIDYELGYYKEFQSTDLVEGEKRFREEDFNVWPQWGYDLKSGSESESR